MNPTYFLFFGIVAVLLVLLGWTLRTPRKRSVSQIDLTSLEQSGRRHATYFAPIQQALSPADIDFLVSRGSPKLGRRVKKERRRVVLVYLRALRSDFRRLLHLARALAVVSPEVGAAQELERFRLAALFSCRYQMVLLTLHSGSLAPPQLGGLSHLVSELAVQMEVAMKELGERAVLAGRLGSSLDGSGLDVPAGGR
jgi:hypothetical protein